MRSASRRTALWLAALLGSLACPSAALAGHQFVGEDQPPAAKGLTALSDLTSDGVATIAFRGTHGTLVTVNTRTGARRDVPVPSGCLPVAARLGDVLVDCRTGPTLAQDQQPLIVDARDRRVSPIRGWRASPSEGVTSDELTEIGSHWFGGSYCVMSSRCYAIEINRFTGQRETSARASFDLNSPQSKKLTPPPARILPPDGKWDLVTWNGRSAVEEGGLPNGKGIRVVAAHRPPVLISRGLIAGDAPPPEIAAGLFTWLGGATSDARIRYGYTYNLGTGIRCRYNLHGPGGIVATSNAVGVAVRAGAGPQFRVIVISRHGVSGIPRQALGGRNCVRLVRIRNASAA
jgi:hypothetical protein